MIISDGRITLNCPACGAVRKDVGFKINMTYMWKNQNGCCIRLFCHCCEAVSTITDVYSAPKIEVRIEKFKVDKWLSEKLT